MVATLLGQKGEMSHRYDDRGRRVPVTAVVVEPNLVLGRRTPEQHGYSAVQLGIGRRKHVKKPIVGQFKKIAPQIPRFISEASISPEDTITPGTVIPASKVFHKGLLVKVTGISKGKGFAGVVKRWGFAGGPKTHGQSDRLRAPGSIGQTTTPGRVYKGKHMAGHMGNVQASVVNLEVMDVDRERNVVYVKGPIPGYTGSLVTMMVMGRVKAYQPPPEEKPEEEALSAPAEVETSEKPQKDEKNGELGK